MNFASYICALHIFTQVVNMDFALPITFNIKVKKKIVSSLKQEMCLISEELRRKIRFKATDVNRHCLCPELTLIN